MDEIEPSRKITLAGCLLIMLISIFTLVNQYRGYEQSEYLKTKVLSQNQAVDWVEYDTTNRYYADENDDFETTSLQDTDLTTNTEINTAYSGSYILNKNSKKVHTADCQYAQNMKEENRVYASKNDLSDYYEKGYSVCSKCKAGQ